MGRGPPTPPDPPVSPQNVPPDLAVCCFVLEQSLSVRALQEMLANSSDIGSEVGLGSPTRNFGGSRRFWGGSSRGPAGVSGVLEVV